MSFENIKYDIILPFYDDYEFLDFQINCINYQTLKATNLIFIDDGNKDKDLEKNLRLKINPEINIVFISFPKNMGLFYGLNVGFDKLQSEYFRIGATDDFSDKNLASESLKILNKYKKRNFVFSNNITYLKDKNKKIKINFNFLNKEEYTSNEVDLIFKKNQFKIYHNTVFYRTKFFLKNHLFQEKYGFRCDYLNLLYFSHLSGFVYVDKFLSEFTVRKGQINKMHDYKYLTGETKFIKKKNINFYNFYIENGLHYDFSPLSIFRYKFHKNSLFSMKWFVRSIKFRIWKQIRSILPNNIIQFLSNY